MTAVNLKSLIGKLNDVCTRSLEGAAGLCMSRTNYNVEIEHWLLKLLEGSNTDIHAIAKAFAIDPSRLTADVMKAIDKLKTGNSSQPLLSQHTVDLAREAWVLGSIDYSAGKTRSGHLLLALLTDTSLSQIARGISKELDKISPEALARDLQTILADSSEAGSDVVSSSSGSGGGGTPGPRPGGQTPHLDQYTIDLTARAREGKIDPVLGRDSEIRQIVDILTRRRQNNPIMTGEAGVGKTAVVEGFALRIAQGDVPPALQTVALRTLDLSLLQAGAGVKGEFENRLKGVIEEVNRSVTPIILFIDEAHTLIGAGGQAGQGDAANMLKPALARGELRTIAATTWAEYKKYFERDAALARRFQVVKVDEPEISKAIAMMRGLVDTLQDHHKIEILNEAVEDSVRLSSRYISGRQLPDKCVSLLDTACARVAIGHTTTPPAIEDCQRTIDQTSVAIEVLERELATGADHAEEVEALKQKKEETKARYEELKEQWTKERELIDQIRDIRGKLSGESVPQHEENAEAADTKKEADGKAKDAKADQATAEKPAADSPADAAKQPPLSEEDRAKLIAELEEIDKKLEEIQGENPLMQACVDSQAVAEIVSSWTGIPVGRMVSDEINTILALDKEMQKRVVGQDHGLKEIAERIRTSRANLTDPDRPIGVFFLVGPSGVGKTETAITLAELLYGGEQNMTTINMSEFKEEHKVSLLMGSPPGYVGYGEGGVLTEAVRRKPYSVVLLDEMEKAHSGVQDVFYQVFDKGNMKDGEGRDIDFRNTVIIMTSNAATETMMKLCADPETMPAPEALALALHPELLKSFKPAFLGRIVVVPYFPLSDDIMRQIAVLKLGKVARRVNEHYDAEFTWTDAVLDHIVSRCTEVDSGARNVDRILTGSLLPQMSAEFLSRMAEGESVSSAVVNVTDDGEFQFTLT
ncbi:type VI secretion system ATPase TssH [Fuerstiella marisgermanici]|uniref:Chaperone protein ClpB n=1 Tax=Fuerstiella marisgermanici TaxID=1891926 RepID=A0A1P8WE47_9PLAN|nr:type VI secretion system ATPase TssH [Fuerstiella marisgermanici]APZ92333.1 Chaperone protein ClpB [Fuerstiella marisgermanici]